MAKEKVKTQGVAKPEVKEIDHCGICRFFLPKENDLGPCRRSSPTTMGWPILKASNWCGEFEKREGQK